MHGEYIYTTPEKSVDADANVVKDATNIGEQKNVFYVRFVVSQLLLHPVLVKNMLKDIMLCSFMLDRCKTSLLRKTSDARRVSIGSENRHKFN